MFSSSRKPRFNLDISIHEISNIPQVGGYCYIEIQIKDGKKILPHILHKASSAVDDSSKSSSAISLDKPERLHSSSDVSASTSLRKIHNFKCMFNYNMNCNLKFSVKKKDNRISSKYLVMKVYYVSEEDVKRKDNEKLSTHRKQRMELGRLELNLSEYINIEEPLNSKYLMNDSKVNSILNLTIFLNELPENYDFHTQLQINDMGGRSSASSSFSAKKTQNRALTTKQTKYNAPNLERTKIFGGLNDVIKTSDASPSLANLSVSSLLSDDSDKQNQTKTRSGMASKATNDESVASNQRSSRDHGNSEDHAENAGNFTNGTTAANVMMDPIVSSLYKKILESTWDPELNDLLDFTPEECIADIFNNGGDGWNRTISQNFGTWSDENNENEQIDEYNGLINEASFREDLRSWSVSDIRP